MLSDEQFTFISQLVNGVNTYDRIFDNRVQKCALLLTVFSKPKAEITRFKEILNAENTKKAV